MARHGLEQTIVPSELDPPQDAIDTALTAMMALDERPDRLAGHD